MSHDCSQDSPFSQPTQGFEGLGAAIKSVACLLDSLHCGAVLNDPQGRIVRANDRLCKMIGRDAASLEGVIAISLFRHADRSPVTEDDRLESSWEGEARLEQVGGDLLSVAVSVKVMPTNSILPDYRVATIIDITEAVESRRRLREQISAMDSMSNTLIEQSLELKKTNQSLEVKVLERTQALNDAQHEAMRMLAVACEARDHDTGDHVSRVQLATERLATALGYDPYQAREMGFAAALHDVGKLHTPDAILLKPGPLNDDERSVMQQHTLAGENILGRLDYFAPARRIARSHHEAFDGSGYPDGLIRDSIPIEARVVHVVDVYDALTHARPYKKAWALDEAQSHIESQVNSSFDPEIVKAFFASDAAKSMTTTV